MSETKVVDLKDHNVMIAWPAYDGKLYIDAMLAYMTTAHELASRGCGVGFNARMGSSLIPKCRDEIIHQFLFDENQKIFDYLLCIDSDVIWNPEAVPPMLAASIAHDDAVIFGSYPVKKDEPLFHIEPMEMNGKSIQSGPLLRVNSGAAGFMLLPRSVLEKMYEAYKDELCYTASGDFASGNKVCSMFMPAIIRDKYRGEDIAFCMRMGKIGIRMYLDPRINLTHVGEKKYNHSLTDYLDNMFQEN
jgi:hypothetical protein